MSKKIRAQPAGTFVSIAALLTLILIAGTAGGRAAQKASPARAINAKSAAVMAATAEVLRETSEVRKLGVLHSVRSGAQSREEIERMIIRSLNESSTPEEMRASERALKKFGLLPADFQLRPFIIKLLTEQVAGYYDPKTQEFYLADWIDIDGQRPVMAHELTHALQDQHFNLRRFEKWPRGDSDAELAAHALIEGDATIAMLFYAMRHPLQALSMMRSDTASEASMEQLKQAPRALRESLLFPYEQGSAWAMQLHRRGGWEEVSRAYTILPQSTEQILHPEKYFAREAPVKASVPNLSRLLGVGWRRTDTDVNGEWSLYLVLEEYLKSDTESRDAAAGWGGDHYALYEGARPGEVMIAQLSVWDTEEDASQFFEAYAKRTSLRYAAERIDVSGHQPASVYEWRTSEGNVIIERRGARVAILEGVPKRADAKKLRRTFWR